MIVRKEYIDSDVHERGVFNLQKNSYSSTDLLHRPVFHHKNYMQAAIFK